MDIRQRHVVSSDGATIGAVVAGDGSPIVLLHGICASASSWLPLVRMLQGGHTVYSVDRRGRGLSEDRQEHDLDLEVADFLSVLSIISEPVTVLGHSYGATVALLAAARTEQIARLIAYEPLLVPPTAALEGAAATIEDLVQRDNRDAAVSHLLDQFDMPGLVPTLRNLEPAWNRLARDVHTVPRELRSLVSIDDHVSNLRQISCRVELVSGDRTVPAFLLSAVEAYRRLATVDVKILAGHNHFATLVAPDLIADHILNVDESGSAEAPTDGRRNSNTHETRRSPDMPGVRIAVCGATGDGASNYLRRAMMPASGNEVVVLNDEDLVTELPQIRPDVVVASVAAWELLKRNAESLISRGPDAHTVLQPILGYALDLQTDVEAGRLGASMATEMSLLTAAFSRLRRKVGLERVVLAVASGGDLPQLLRRWFGAIGVTLIDDSEVQAAL